MHEKRTALPLISSDKERSGPIRSILYMGIFCTLILGLVYLFWPTWLQYFDNRIFDIFLQSAPHKPASRDIVIVDIDEKSLQEFGQWPWPRSLVAELLEKINSRKPQTVSIDMIFSEPDRMSIGPLLDGINRQYGFNTGNNTGIGTLPADILDNDQRLGETLEKGPYILATKFNFNQSLERSGNCELHSVKTIFRQEADSASLNNAIFNADSVLCNIWVLAHAVNNSGFFNIIPDHDGIIRRAPLVISYQGKMYPNLALATLLKLAGTDQIILNFAGGELESIKFLDRIIPVDAAGNMIIRFRGPRRSYEYVSAADVLNGSMSAVNLTGKIVFLGTSAAGLRELRATPYDPIFPGVEIHASIIDTILSGDFLATYHWITGLILLLVVVLGLLSSIILSRAGSLSGLAFISLSFILLWFGARWMFYSRGVFFPFSSLFFSLTILYLLLTAFKYRLEEQKVLARTRELLVTQNTTIESMATLAEYRDPETGGHIKRTREYIRLLAKKMQETEKYKNILTDQVIDMLYKSAPLHDIGKVGVPDNILLKADDLSNDEYEIMKRHTVMGRDVILAAEANLGRDSFLKIAEEMAYTHQEKWDGSGYPQGLKGEEIPISGRLMALADVYDALISRRPYKRPYPHQSAINSIKIASGSHFDPEIVEAFLEVEQDFREIAITYADTEEEREILLR